MYVCGCVGVYVCGCEYKIIICSLYQGGANWGNEKCRWGEVIRIICLLMNLTDPKGGGRNCAQPPPSMQPCTVCLRY